MVGKSTDENTETATNALPEPPKFNVEDLPQPPKMPGQNIASSSIIDTKLDSEKTLSNLSNTASYAEQSGSSDIPNPPTLNAAESASMQTELPMPPPMKEESKKKGGFFSNFFKKKNSETTSTEVALEEFEKEESENKKDKKDKKDKKETKDEKSEPLKNTGGKIDLAPIDDSMFAPPTESGDLKEEDGSIEKPDLEPPKFNSEEKDSSDLPEPDMGFGDIKVPPAMEPLSSEAESKIVFENESSDASSDDWYDEGEKFLEEWSVGAESAKRIEPESVLKEIDESSDEEPKTKTELSEVKGVGPARAKKLKKAGIKTAEHLTKHDHKKIAEKTKISEKHAKEMIKHAKKVVKEKIKKAKKDKAETKKGISDIVKQLEKERKDLEKIKKEGDFDKSKLEKLDGHKELVKVLEKLESKRKSLLDQEKSLREKEQKISKHEETYRRDLDYVDNLKRRLDHEIRERTQYLITTEKEYFQKAQDLAKKKADVEIKGKSLDEKEKFLKERDDELKKKLNELEDRTITIESKESKFEKIMQELDKQDVVLREREDDLLKRESEYMKKLDALESHEKAILKNLEEQRRSLESKEKEIELREKKLHKKQRNVDKKSIATEYAQNVLESEKSKLIDDEFEQYLRDQLSGMKDSGITMNDMNLVKNLHVVQDQPRTESIYQLIDTCKDLVRSKRVTEAKVFYNQLRDKYYGKSFGNQKEKEAVHNMIRALYDEINLADIGVNR